MVADWLRANPIKRAAKVSWSVWSLFSDKLESEASADQSGATYSATHHLALFSNKKLKRTNTLAYFVKASLKKKDSFIWAALPDDSIICKSLSGAPYSANNT
jgi:hypothetical protein